MSDPKPDLDGPSPASSPVNEARLTATNSQIGNAAQIFNSPGAVVNQVHAEASSTVTGILTAMCGLLLFLLVGVLPLLGSVVPRGLSVCLVGLSSALIVGGFSLWVETLLKIESRRSCAAWLSAISATNGIKELPSVISGTIDRLSFEDRFSIGFVLSGTSVFVSLPISMLFAPEFAFSALPHSFDEFAQFGAGLTAVGFVCGCGIVLARLSIAWMGRLRWLWAQLILLLTNTVAAILLGWASSISASSTEEGIRAHRSIWSALVGGTLAIFTTPIRLDAAWSEPHVRIWYFVPALLPTVLIWVYAVAGLLVKAARRLDIGFQWFNRKFDIEAKPVSAIGFVGGALVALVYWTAVIVSRFVGQ